ncbi:uncharacterized protein LOC127264850 [Andrographis paniculata]|uniref:uncharacterized protein LOC127264850 n=1 Tax=Andrographis paniculata TaxID=175694 RepID=UPI0021E7868A|nr:uncharacterized protein LOC127264850 [Andrographis paniculata]
MASFNDDLFDDFMEEEYATLRKQPRLDNAHSTQPQPQPQPQQSRSQNSDGLVLPRRDQFDPKGELPLELNLDITPQLLNLIQLKLDEDDNASAFAPKAKIASATTSTANDKLKASTFSAKLLRIGTWKYESRYQCDLVVKLYFAKRKLVWEFLEDGLKRKIEILWDNITGLKGDFPKNKPGRFTIMLDKVPNFFRENNPQPRKHTVWEPSSDITDGQASVDLKHYIECSPGVLNSHFEKLIRCDARLAQLSRHPTLVFDSKPSSLRNITNLVSPRPAPFKYNPLLGPCLDNSPQLLNLFNEADNISDAATASSTAIVVVADAYIASSSSKSSSSLYFSPSLLRIGKWKIKKPMFFREDNPQLGIKAIWQPRIEFTNGNASVCLECASLNLTIEKTTWWRKKF